MPKWFKKSLTENKKIMAKYHCLLVASICALSSCSPAEKKDVGAVMQTDSNHEHLKGDTIQSSPPSALPVINRIHYHTIEIKQMKFHPAELNIARGDTVVWVNNGITSHDVTEQPANKWNSPSMPVGTSWQMIATESADYNCSIHVVMKGKLVIRQVLSQ